MELCGVSPDKACGVSSYLRLRRLRQLATLDRTTFNEFLFAGEQFDSDLNLYNNRARYLNVSTGRFWTMDTFEGDQESPLSLHKYLYSYGDPVNRMDPSGHEVDQLIAAALRITVAVIAIVTAAVVVEYVTSLLGKTPSDDEMAKVKAAIAVLNRVPSLNSEDAVLYNAKYRRTKPPYLYVVCRIAGCFASEHLGFLFLYDKFLEPILHDDVERAAVLLHEAFHLEGASEHDAYAGVWVNKEKFGWTLVPYSSYFLWSQVETETKRNAPELFK